MNHDVMLIGPACRDENIDYDGTVVRGVGGAVFFCDFAVRASGATNGSAIHLSGAGVPVIVIGIPVRYAHTHYGISAYSDFDNAVKLACALLRRFDRELIYSF